MPAFYVSVYRACTTHFKYDDDVFRLLLVFPALSLCHRVARMPAGRDVFTPTVRYDDVSDIQQRISPCSQISRDATVGGHQYFAA